VLTDLALGIQVSFQRFDDHPVSAKAGKILGVRPHLLRFSLSPCHPLFSSLRYFSLIPCPLPSPEQQIEFLIKIKRLLGEGRFVASYKFALIQALADLSFEREDDSGKQLKLSGRVGISGKIGGILLGTIFSSPGKKETSKRLLCQSA